MSECNEAKSTIFQVIHWKAGSQWIHRILKEIAQERIVDPKIDAKQFLETPLVCGAVYPTVYVTSNQFLRCFTAAELQEDINNQEFKRLTNFRIF